MLLIAATTLLLSSCYVLGQGAHLVSHQLSATPIDELEDRDEFFERVESIREFARRRLDLSDTQNYTSYVELDRDHLVSVVSATKADSFNRKTWWFPLFGRFPYKGYYQERAARRLADRLRRQGYDVFVRRVDAFSTLGYFRDPLFSFMKDYDDFRLASLIIHEQTHATLFLKNQIQFNEELATFVGHHGALQYVAMTHGEQSEEYREAAAYRRELNTFLAEVRKLHGRLRTLYERAEEKGFSEAEVVSRKAAIISSFQEQFAAYYDDRFVTDRFRWFADYPINNAVIDVYMKYTQDLDLFERLYRACDKSIPRMLSKLAPLKDHRGDPKAYVRSVLLDEADRS
jgi:predicted aminopeptidase